MDKILVVYESNQTLGSSKKSYTYYAYIKYGELKGEPCTTRSNAKRSFIRLCRFLEIPLDILDFSD